MKQIDNLILELKNVDNITSHSKYIKAVLSIIDSYGYEFKDSGSYTEVYVNKSKYVIKICAYRHEKFHLDYPEGYLKPIFLSENKWLAIQPKATTYSDIEKKITKIEYKINKLKEENKEHKALLRKFKVNKVKNHKKIEDLRPRNMGLVGDEFYMIDLNNHVCTP